MKKDEILLEKKNDEIIAYLIGDEKLQFDDNNKIIPYLWMSCLITNNTPNLKSCGGALIESVEKLGTKSILYGSLLEIIPEEAVNEIEKYTGEFIKFIGDLHDKYILLIEENDFLKISLKYFYEAEKKNVNSDEGFIDSITCLEALFNESSNDIKYKLSHRAGFLLGLFKYNSIEVYEKLKKFYNDRSNLVHGNGALKYEKDRYLIEEYTRSAIIIFLILLSNDKRKEDIKKKDRKNQILKEIDHAMLDYEKSNNLKKEIDIGIEDFKLNIPRVFEGKGKKGNYYIHAW